MQRKGFSRVELVVLSAVAVVIGSLLLPVVAQNRAEAPVTCMNCRAEYNFCPQCGQPLSARAEAALKEESSPRKICRDNLKQIALGLAQYVQDYDERMPPAAIGAGPQFIDGSYQMRASSGWAEVIDPYIQNRQIFQCPVEINAAQSDSTKPGYTDYWYNRNCSKRFSGDFASSSQTITAGDGDGGYQASTVSYNLNALPASWLTTPGSPARRHRFEHDGANYAFADGHVKWLKPEQVSTMKVSALKMDKFSFSLK